MNEALNTAVAFVRDYAVSAWRRFRAIVASTFLLYIRIILIIMILIIVAATIDDDVRIFFGMP